MIGQILTKSSGSFKGRIRYIFGCTKHDHEISKIVTIDSNCLSKDPLPGVIKGDETDLTELIEEFNMVEKYRKLSIDSERPIKPVFHAILSLLPGESLSKEQWQVAARTYLMDLGFGETNKYVIVMHQDKDHQHIHIVANRINFEERFGLVKDSNERTVSLNSVSTIEDMFGIYKAPKPHETWGKNITREELEASNSSGDIPLKHKMIAKIAGAIEATRSADGDIFDLVRLLRQQKVYLHITLNDEGQPKGVAYEYTGKVISGRQLKRSRLTWQKLITQEGINYDPKTIHELQEEIARRDSEKHSRILRVYYYEFYNQKQRFYVRYTAKQIELMKLIEAVLKIIDIIFGGGFIVRRCEPVKHFIDYDISKPLDFKRQIELTLQTNKEARTAPYYLGLE